MNGNIVERLQEVLDSLKESEQEYSELVVEVDDKGRGFVEFVSPDNSSEVVNWK